jgi:hypothetical protein
MQPILLQAEALVRPIVWNKVAHHAADLRLNLLYATKLAFSEWGVLMLAKQVRVLQSSKQCRGHGLWRVDGGGGAAAARTRCSTCSTMFESLDAGIDVLISFGTSDAGEAKADPIPSVHSSYKGTGKVQSLLPGYSNRHHHERFRDLYTISLVFRTSAKTRFSAVFVGNLTTRLYSQSAENHSLRCFGTNALLVRNERS